MNSLLAILIGILVGAGFAVGCIWWYFVKNTNW